MNDKDQSSNKPSGANAGSIFNDRDSMENMKDYISGDSTPSSSGHQFSNLAAAPKNESKKSAQKTKS